MLFSVGSSANGLTRGPSFPTLIDLAAVQFND